MKTSVLRWVFPLLGLFVVGPAVGWLASGLRASDGSPHFSLLTSVSPARALGTFALAFALAAGLGSAAARLVSRNTGLFSAGMVLAWASWPTGSIEGIIRRTQSVEPLRSLVFEGPIVGLLSLVTAGVIIGAARARASAGGSDARGALARLRDPQTLFGIAAGVPVAGVVAWFIAQEPSKGQSIAAGALAALAAAAVARLAFAESHALAAFVAVAVLTAAGPLAASAAYGSDAALLRAAYADVLLPLARPLPIDWMAGAFLGTPIGLSWASSMVQKKPEG
ncbi:MAG: hypothetical protein JNM07_08160 [Phycisphaerae bacterium]|nr:hypothetical protein [Phycisphaerae bacterium]